MPAWKLGYGELPSGVRDPAINKEPIIKMADEKASTNNLALEDGIEESSQLDGKTLISLT